MFPSRKYPHKNTHTGIKVFGDALEFLSLHVEKYFNRKALRDSKDIKDYIYSSCWNQLLRFEIMV